MFIASGIFMQQNFVMSLLF